MHNTRATHNAHNETQRRLAKNKNVWWFHAPMSHSRKGGEDIFYTEHKGSKKPLKRIGNRCFRKNRISNECNIINKKVLSAIADEWCFI